MKYTEARQEIVEKRAKYLSYGNWELIETEAKNRLKRTATADIDWALANGMSILAENQELPENPFSSPEPGEPDIKFAFHQGQISLKDSGFRRIVEK